MTKSSEQVGGIGDDEVVAPDRFRARVGGLLRANCDLVAKSKNWARPTQ